MKPLRIVFAGTPMIAALQLQTLLASPHQVVRVYTQPDRPAGRGRRLQPSAVRLTATSANLLVQTPQNLLDAAELLALSALQPDIMLVVAYGLKIPAPLLNIPRLGCINIHTALLPRWRGAAPVTHALLAGEQKTGISFMVMNAGWDTGPVLKRVALAIHSDDTTASLTLRLAELAQQQLLPTLAAYDAGQLTPVPQNEQQVSYAPKVRSEDAQVTWDRPALQIERVIRAYQPWPVAYCDLAGKRLRLLAASVLPDTTTAPAGTVLAQGRAGLDVACQPGVLRIEMVQWAGGKAMSAAAFCNGYASILQPGEPWS